MDRRAGFSIRPNIFTRERMLALLDVLAGADLATTKAGARHVMRVPEVRALADDASMIAIAREYLGPAAFPFCATLFDKSLDANWLVGLHASSKAIGTQRRRVLHVEYASTRSLGPGLELSV